MSKTDKVDTRIYFNEPSLAVQASKDDCDINMIVEKAKRGADLSHLSMRTPLYGDFTNVPSFREALQLVNAARDAFMSLDAFVRERFGNDPARMIDFVQDPKNRDEAIKLGLIVPPPDPKPDEHLDTLKSIDSSLKARSDSKSKGRGHADRDEE